MAMRNHSGRYSKRYKRTHYWNKVQRKPVGPYGGLDSVVPNGLFVKLTNSFDFGMKCDGPNFDIRYAVSDFVFGNWAPAGAATIPLFTDQMSATIYATTPGANNMLYRAYHENQALPVGWTAKINPYTRYQVKGMKVKWTINPRMTSAWVNNTAAGTTGTPDADYDIVRVGMMMDPSVGDNNWYANDFQPGDPTLKDQSTWNIYDQKIWKELPAPIKNQKCVLSKYFDFAKYYRQPPQAYTASAFNNSGQYSANFVYDYTTDGSTGRPSSATQPTSKAYLHFMLATIGNYVDAGAPSGANQTVCGTIKTTYYVWLHQANTLAGWYFGRGDGT